MKPRRFIIVTALTTAATMLLWAQAAFGAEDGCSAKAGKACDIGNNLKGIILSWTKPLLIAVAGMMAFAAFGQRQTGKLVTVVITAIGVGGFVFAGDQIESLIKFLWTGATGG